jgi:phage host-nuclease inhibitor protein Gam
MALGQQAQRWLREAGSLEAAVKKYARTNSGELNAYDRGNYNQLVRAYNEQLQRQVIEEQKAREAKEREIQLLTDIQREEIYVNTDMEVIPPLSHQNESNVNWSDTITPASSLIPLAVLGGLYFLGDKK